MPPENPVSPADRALRHRTSPRQLRAGVGFAVRSTGLPHGFTITVWSTAQAAIAAHGPPPVGFITLFAVSAVTVYWVLRAVMAGTSPESEASVQGPGGWLVQAAAVAVPVGTMAVTARLLPSGVCWPTAGAVTVLGYLGVMGIGAAEPRQ